jgi:hypothetical protein
MKRGNSVKASTEGGFLIVATVIGIVIFSAIAVSFVEVVESESTIVGASIRHQKAWNIARVGLNRAIKTLSADGNWADTPATLFSSVSFDGGSYTVTTSAATQDSITLQSVGIVEADSAVITRSLAVQPDDDYPGFLDIDLDDLAKSGNRLYAMELRNRRLYNAITLDKVRLSIAENPNLTLQFIKVRLLPTGPWTPLWTGSAPLGTLLDVTDQVMTPGSTYEMEITFSGNLTAVYTYTLEIHLSDQSVYSDSDSE